MHFKKPSTDELFIAFVTIYFISAILAYVIIVIKIIFREWTIICDLYFVLNDEGIYFFTVDFFYGI